MTGPTICDACGTLVVQRGDVVVHVDRQAAAKSNVGPHEPLKIDPGTVGYIRDVLGGGR